MYAMRQRNFVGLVWRLKLDGRIGRHYGVLLPSGHVAHLSPHGVVAIVSLAEFAQRLAVTLEKAAPDDRHLQIQWRAQQSVGRVLPYDLWTQNCQHYATWVIGEKPESSQVNAAVCLLLLGTLALLARQH